MWTPFDDGANGGSADVFFTYSEYGYSSMETWSYSREWVWNLRMKLCCIASWKWYISRVKLQKPFPTDSLRKCDKNAKPNKYIFLYPKIQNKQQDII